jgi:hypothetical protein
VIVVEHDSDAPRDRPWWFLLWEKADALVAMDPRVTVPPTVDVPFLLHRDASAGIDFDTYPYGRGPRELALGMLVTFIPPEKQDGYRIADHDRRDLLGYCAEKLGFASLDHLAAAGAVSLSIWYDGSLVYRVARAMHELGLALPLLRGEVAVQRWYEIARDDRRDAAPFHQIDGALAAIPQRRLEEAGSPTHIVACSLVSARVTGGVRELERRAEAHAAAIARWPFLQQLRDYLRDTWSAGDRVPWPVDGRHFFDTDEIRQNPPGIVRGVRS